MTRMTTLLIVTVSSFFTLLAIDAILAFTVFGTEDLSPNSTPIEPKPKPGTVMIVTFDIGTTKAIRSESTNVKEVNGGYFVLDPSVKATQPLQSKAVSKTIVNQLVSVFVDVRIADPPPPPTTSKGCGEGCGYYVDDPSPICEPLDAIGKGPSKDIAFCTALGCPYNPPNPHGPPIAPAEPEPPTDEKCNVNPSEVVCLFEPQPGDPDYPGDPVAPEPEPEHDSDDGGEGDGGAEEGNTSEEEISEEE